ncbi:MAG TPA: hypothetical protein PKD53_28090 [Chloroflexaceae bacterium]|nr:hypothetical protein [Chloroflexaceae bacterium]
MAGNDEQGVVWYEGLGFDIGARVMIAGAAERAEAGAAAGSVVGFDASGPRPGESFIRVLVQPDGPTPTIVALPPASLEPEAGSELAGLARSILTGLEQSLRPAGFAALLAWLTGDEGRALAATPTIRLQRVRAGGVSIPGLVFPELVELAAERLAEGDDRS